MACTCATCALCLLRPGSMAEAAPCRVLVGKGADTIYVEVNQERDCDCYVDALAVQEPWTDEQRHQLVLAAEHMKTVTGHRIVDCVMEMASVVREYWILRSAWKGEQVVVADERTVVVTLTRELRDKLMALGLPFTRGYEFPDGHRTNEENVTTVVSPYGCVTFEEDDDCLFLVDTVTPEQAAKIALALSGGAE